MRQVVEVRTQLGIAQDDLAQQLLLEQEREERNLEELGGNDELPSGESAASQLEQVAVYSFVCVGEIHPDSR